MSHLQNESQILQLLPSSLRKNAGYYSQGIELIGKTKHNLLFA
jgi:hypothetical protein